MKNKKTISPVPFRTPPNLPLERGGMGKRPKLIVILGPTASGKTAMATRLAKKFNGEIINADSRAIYREMKVATSRPGLKEGGVRHHLVGFREPDSDFGLAEYKKLAVDKINNVLARGKQPFLVGGTWLYIRAVADNLEIPQVAPNKVFRKKLEKLSAKVLWARLQKADPEAAKKIHANDKRRVIRAMEVIHYSGRKISEQQKAGEPLYQVLKIGIKRGLDEIEMRARTRIKKEMGEKLIRETRKLLKKYLPAEFSGATKPKRSGGFSAVREAGSPDLPAMTSLGYREIGEYLRGNLTKTEAFELLAKNTRRFARYQLNTFRQDKKIKWVKNLKGAERRIGKFLK
ncbi:MAG: tRNA (adenosine(37)-N6)-dimethylallyltransferase MiaA [bacterium]